MVRQGLLCNSRCLLFTPSRRPPPPSRPGRRTPAAEPRPWVEVFAVFVVAHLVGDFALQTTQVFKNLVAALEAAGAGPRNLVKLTTFVTDLSHLPDFRRVRDQFQDPAHPPASTLVQVTRLFRLVRAG